MQAIVEAFAAYLPQEQEPIVSVAQLRIYAGSFRKTLGVMIDKKLAIEADYYHHEEDQIAALVFQFKEKEKADIEKFQEVDLDFLALAQLEDISEQEFKEKLKAETIISKKDQNHIVILKKNSLDNWSEDEGWKYARQIIEMTIKALPSY